MVKKTPTYQCLNCNQDADVQWQESLLPHKEGYWLITCYNKACYMEGMTLSSSSYDDPEATLKRYECAKKKFENKCRK